MPGIAGTQKIGRRDGTAVGTPDGAELPGPAVGPNVSSAAVGEREDGVLVGSENVGARVVSRVGGSVRPVSPSGAAQTIRITGVKTMEMSALPLAQVSTHELRLNSSFRLWWHRKQPPAGSHAMQRSMSTPLQVW